MLYNEDKATKLDIIRPMLYNEDKATKLDIIRPMLYNEDKATKLDRCHLHCHNFFKNIIGPIGTRARPAARSR